MNKVAQRHLGPGEKHLTLKASCFHLLVVGTLGEGGPDHTTPGKFLKIEVQETVKSHTLGEF